MALRTFAAACLFAAAAINSAFAQSDNNGPRDERIQIAPPRTQPTESADDVMMRKLREGKAGVVLMDVDYLQGLIGKCDAMDVALGRLVSGAWRYSVLMGPTPSGYLAQPRYMPAAALDPGEYFMIGMVCKNGNRRTELEAPFAKFQVNAGEAVNLGLLKLHYLSKDILFGTKGSMKKTVEGMTPERKAELAKVYPNLFAKAVERRMVVIGSAEADMTKQGKSILTGAPCPRGQPICP
jgi:hypothetical protein